MCKKLCALLLIYLFSFNSFARAPILFESYAFNENSNNFIGEFTDYPSGEESFYELAWGWENIPDQANQKGLYLAGNNHSDDLFMFLKKPIDGLTPNTEYKITFNVKFSTNVPEGTLGTGGSPGESVYFKVGASSIEPEKIIINGSYQLTVDKGNQQTSGVNAITVGDLANPLVDPMNPTFIQKTVTNVDSPLAVKSDQAGRVWIFLGTDSAFESLSKYYINSITIEIMTIE